MVSRNLRDGQIKIKDGTTPTPLSVTLTLEEGDLSFSVKKEYKQIRDRGALDHVRAGDEQVVPVSFSIKLDRVSEATSPVTLYDALRKVRSAAAWVSVAGAGEPYAVIIEFTVLDPAGGADDEVITFAKFFPEDVTFAEGDDYNTLSVSGFSFETAPAIT